MWTIVKQVSLTILFLFIFSHVGVFLDSDLYMIIYFKKKNKRIFWLVAQVFFSDQTIEAVFNTC